MLDHNCTYITIITIIALISLLNVKKVWMETLVYRHEMGNAIRFGSIWPNMHTAFGLQTGLIALQMYILFASFVSQSAKGPADSSSTCCLFPSPSFWSS